MASNIDITQPPAGNPTTAAMRANMLAAKTEIESLQQKKLELNTAGTGFADAAGNMLASRQLTVSSGALMILPSSGDILDDGFLFNITAFPANFGKAFLYFPAGALYAGSVAGFYYTELTGTSVGTVSNDRWAGGIPVYPETPTPIVATGPGAYTQVTNTDITAASFVVPGGALGDNGTMTVYPLIGANNTSNTKAWTVKYANNTLIGKSNTTQTLDQTPAVMRNVANQITKIGSGFTGFISSSAVVQRFSADSSIDQEAIITLKILTATDFMFLQGYNAVIAF